MSNHHPSPDVMRQNLSAGFRNAVIMDDILRQKANLDAAVQAVAISRLAEAQQALQSSMGKSW